MSVVLAGPGTADPLSLARPQEVGVSSQRPEAVQILGPKTVELMVADHLGPEIENNIEKTDPTRKGYGFGLTMAARRP